MQERDELEHIQQTRGWAVQHLLANRTDLKVDEVISEAKKLADFCLNVDIEEARTLGKLRGQQEAITVSNLEVRANAMKAASERVDGSQKHDA